MRNKLTLRFTMLILLFTLIGFIPVLSAGQEQGKIGVVDVLKVYKSWEVQKKADAEFQPLREKLQEQDKNLAKMKDDLRKQQNVLKQEQIAKKESEIKAMERELRDGVESLSENIDKTADKLSKELDTKLKIIYDSLSEKEGYTLILEKRAVRYSKPEMDLTDQITEQLNKIEIPEPAKSGSSKTKPESSSSSVAPKKEK